MRWTFHKRRNRRYQIALEELKRSFVERGGNDLVRQIKSMSLKEFSLREKRLLKELDLIKTCFNPYSHDYKKRHTQFLKVIRRLLKHFKKHPPENAWQEKFLNLSLELCKTKFYRIHLFLFGHHLLQDLFASLIHQKDETKLDFDTHFLNYNFLDESDLIINSTPAIFLERDFRKFIEIGLGVTFDPHKYNHPFLLYTLAFYRKGKICKLKMVRMGSPTKEAWGKRPEVIEEFKGFLMQLKRENKSHLYINKQRTWGTEGLRSHSICKLEAEFDNFFCLSLPSDGAFYLQSAPYQANDNAADFKNHFYKILIGEKASGYYHIPVKWLADETFLSGLQQVLNFVHEYYFKNKEVLSVKERRFFIDHFYTQLILFCLQYKEIQSINITCRDGIDRAGCEQTKLLYFLQLSLGVEDELESKIQRQFLVHIPPYLAKNRPMVKERREYLHELMSHTYDKEIKEGLFKYCQSQPLIYHKPHFVKRA